jgi:ubiquitin carboxyl-terminal hydrolase 7
MENNPDLEFDLILLSTMTYAQVVAKVADKLGADPDKIMLHLLGTKDDRKSIRRFPNATLADIEKSSYINDIQLCKLTYEVLDFSLTEMENNRLIKITWCSPTLNDGSYEELFLPKQSKVADVLQQLKLRGAKYQSQQGSRQVRVFESINHKFHRIVGLNDLISTVSDSAQLYAEELPEEELSIGPDDIYTTVFHYQRDTTRTHSVPFKFLIIKDEPFELTKKRLQRRTGINDKDWAKVKVSIVSAFSASPIDDGKWKEGASKEQGTNSFTTT